MPIYGVKRTSLENVQLVSQSLHSKVHTDQNFLMPRSIFIQLAGYLCLSKSEGLPEYIVETLKWVKILENTEFFTNSPFYKNFPFFLQSLRWTWVTRRRFFDTHSNSRHRTQSMAKEADLLSFGKTWISYTSSYRCDIVYIKNQISSGRFFVGRWNKWYHGMFQKWTGIASTTTIHTDERSSFGHQWTRK